MILRNIKDNNQIVFPDTRKDAPNISKSKKQPSSLVTQFNQAKCAFRIRFIFKINKWEDMPRLEGQDTSKCPQPVTLKHAVQFKS